MQPTILVVDDYSDFLEFLTNQLCGNYTVLTASSGQSALDILEKETVHLMISDVMMPAMDGFELCKQVRSNFNTCHVPVILLTAKGTLEAKIDGLECGADAFIEKPFSPKQLEVQIANLLSNRSKLREFYAKSPLAHVKSIAYGRTDEVFLEQLNKVIQENLQYQELDVEKLAKAMNMSRPTLYRKIRGIANLTPNEFVTISRLKKAAELLNAGRYRISEIADMVGFTSQHYFAQSFHKQFDMTPTEFQMKCKAESKGYQ